MEATYKPVIERQHPAGMGGVQKIYRFDNSYGASVIKTSFSYGGDCGLWELAVIQFAGDGQDDWKVTYDTPITSDVEGHLSSEEVDTLLDKIAALAKATGAA